MNEKQHGEFINYLAATMEIYNAKLTASAIAIWVNALGRYELPALRDALSRHVSSPVSGKFAPRPADIIEILQKFDGRLSADEAWALIPRDEYVSAVLTQEMLTAMGAAQPLLNEGDQVAARMAFKESYSRLVEENRRNGIPIAWIPSLGRDSTMRESVITEAVRLGRISSGHAAGLLPNKELNQLITAGL